MNKISNLAITFKKTSKYIKKHQTTYSLNLVLVIVSVILNLVQPLIWANTIVSIFKSEFIEVYKYCAFMVGFYFLQALVNYVQSLLASHLSEEITFDLKSEMYHKLMGLPMKAFDDTPAGELISRLQYDPEAVADIVINKFTLLLVNILKFLTVIVIMFYLHIELTLVTLTLVPFSIGLFFFSGRLMRKQMMAISVLKDKFFSHIQESFTGIKTIKGLNIQEVRKLEFNNILNILKKKSITTRNYSALSQNISQFFMFCTQVAIILTGSLFVLKYKTLNIAFFLAFNNYSSQFTSSVMEIMGLNSSLQQMAVSIQRILHLQENFDLKEETSGDIHKILTGRVKFINVSFAYDIRTPVFKNINVEIYPNSMNVIIGPSGGGKTTFLNLLLRFYQPSSGLIEIDDIDIDDLSVLTIGEGISIVAQDSFFFNETILNNLLLVNADASLEEVYMICAQAHIHDFIITLPEGYSTVIGDGGSNLSGGQRQRLAVARALLKKSKILLFDEPTSSLDRESQQFINEIMLNLSREHTVIVITHNYSNLHNADRIFYINNGEIIESKEDEINLVNARYV
ncbi:ABC transporter ATP-binding protein [Paenibacillus sp. 22594]|uniref:ABC transporter ATP-binding protein n=1 Tax=Paenibacillus sp. 22594 TaxID=3453947 RepID=UPI003F8652EF